MSTAALRGVVRGLSLDGPPTDAALVTRYCKLNDHGAFAELLRRHGPTVLGVCRRLLRHADADDAFQAVFLVLARKADAVRPPGAVGGWLYGVAVRTARKAKVAAARRWRREMATVANSAREAGACDLDRAELRAVIDAELGRLPDALRTAVVLCDLGGKTRSEAARELGCPEGTVAARLFRGRKLLADRLTRRGVTLPAAGVVTLAVAEPVSADLARATLSAAEAFGAGVPSHAISTTAQSLAEGVVRAMNAGTWKLGLAAVLGAGLLAGGGMWAGDGGKPPPPDGGRPPVAVAKSEAKVTINTPGYVTDVSYSADGKLYAVVAGGKVTVHDAATGKTRWTAAGEAARFTRTPGGRDDLAVMTDKGVVARDAVSGEPHGRTAPRPKSTDGWLVVRFSPDGTRYAARFGNDVQVFDTATAAESVRPAEQYEPGSGLVFPAGRDVFFSPDGTKVVGVGVLVEPGNVGLAVWDVATGHRGKATGGDPRPTAAAVSPDGQTLAEAFPDHVALWGEPKVVDPDAADGRERTRLQPPKRVATAGTPTAVAYSPDGKLLAVGVRRDISEPAIPNRPDLVVPYIVKGHATEVQLFDVASGKEVRRLTGFGKLPVTALAFSPDGKTLLAGTGFALPASLPDDAPKAGEVKAFALTPAAPPKEPNPAADPPAAAERNQDLWAWQERPAKPNPQDMPGPVDAVAFAPGGKEFAGAGPTAVRFWDVPSKELHTVQLRRPGGRGLVAYSPDGKLLALAGEQGGVAVHEAGPGGQFSPGKHLRTVGEDARPTAVAFGPDGGREGRVGSATYRRLAFTDGRSLWATTWVDDAAPGTAVFGPAADAPKVEKPHAGVAYSPDGKRLVFIPNAKIDPTWPGNGRKQPDPAKATHWYAQVWGGGSGEPMHVLPHGPDPVTAVAWAPDGRILTADDKGVVVVWYGTTYKKRAEVKLSGPVTALAARADGKRFVAGILQRLALGRQAGITQIEVKTEQEGSSPDNWMTSSTLRLSPDEAVRSVAFSPDGLALIAGTATADGTSGGVRVWDRVKVAPVEGEGQKPVPATEPPAAATPAPAWKEKVRLTDFAGPVQSVAFTPDGKTLYAGHRLPGRPGTPAVGGVDRFELPAFKRVEQGRNGRDDGATTAVAADPLGRFLVTTIGKGLRVRFLAEPRAAFAPGLPTDSAGELAAVQFSADGSHLAAGNDRTVVVWATDQEKPDTTPARPKGAAGDHPPAFALSPTGDRLAYAHQLDSGAWELAVVWPFSPAAAYQLNRSTGKEPIRAVAWSADGKTLAYAVGSEVVLIDGDGNYMERSRAKIAGRNGGSTVHALALSPDSKTVAAGVQLDAGKGVNRVVLIDAATGKIGEQLMGNSPVPAAAVAWSPDGQTLAVAHGPRPGDGRKYTADELKQGGVAVWER